MCSNRLKSNHVCCKPRFLNSHSLTVAQQETFVYHSLSGSIYPHIYILCLLLRNYTMYLYVGLAVWWSLCVTALGKLKLQNIQDAIILTLVVVWLLTRVRNYGVDIPRLHRSYFLAPAWLSEPSSPGLRRLKHGGRLKTSRCLELVGKQASKLCMFWLNVQRTSAFSSRVLTKERLGQMKTATRGHWEISQWDFISCGHSCWTKVNTKNGNAYSWIGWVKSMSHI